MNNMKKIKFISVTLMLIITAALLTVLVACTEIYDKKNYNITYLSDGNGVIIGEAAQTVVEGEEFGGNCRSE